MNEGQDIIFGYVSNIQMYRKLNFNLIFKNKFLFEVYLLILDKMNSEKYLPFENMFVKKRIFEGLENLADGVGY